MHAPVAACLDALGITEPLPIQRATIADALAGRDVCGQAPTGSGKTLAFAIPLVAQPAQRNKPGMPRGLVLVPTRELAEQVHKVVSSLYGGQARRVAAIYGGVAYGPQRAALRRGVDVVVACPGRLEDLIEQGAIRLDEVELVVLDEADRMVDMGFLKPVRRILDQTSPDRQVLLFSATMGREVEAISRNYQHDPRRYVIAAEQTDMEAVTHHFWKVEHPERVAVTANLIKRHGQAFVFCRTKHGADRVARQLRTAGVTADAIHGDRTQAQRARALASFSSGKTHALVATDVVARGIHVDAVPCVVHFDPPDGPEAYVHRSGRTGRAGLTGTVVSLVASDRQKDVRTIQRALGLQSTIEPPSMEVASWPSGQPATKPVKRSDTPSHHAPNPRNGRGTRRNGPPAHGRPQRNGRGRRGGAPAGKQRSA